MIDYLYDRQIDVILSKNDGHVDTDVQHNYTVKQSHTLLNREVERWQGPCKRVIRARPDGIYGRVPGGGKSFVEWKVYEGWSHQESTVKVNMGLPVNGSIQLPDITIRRTVKALGPVYTFETLEDVENGLRPDGTALQNGDRIKIKKTDKKYHIATDYDPTQLTAEGDRLVQDSILVQTTTERNTQTTITVVPNTTVSIRTPDTGPKPSVSLSVNIVPGQACYKAIVKIHNLCIDPEDIRSWQEMIVVAGYKKGPKLKLVCPIYSSYIESPNPDGVTVFEGLTVGTIGDILRETPIKVIFNAEQVTIGTLLELCTPGIGYHLELENALSDEINNYVIPVTVHQEYYTGNGLSLLNWLQKTVGTIVKQQFNGQLVLQIIDGKLVAFTINGPANKIPKIKERIISLNAVYGATFNGTALTVKAAWNPRLMPGDLFYLPPVYINASKLPNVIDQIFWRNDANLYRIITMSINFASVENINEMQILAMPAQYVTQFEEAKVTTEITAADYEAAYVERLDKAASEITPIYIGDVNDEAQSAQSVKKDETGIQFIDQSSDIDRMLAAAGISTEAYYIQDNDTLSGVSARFYWTDSAGPMLDKTKKGTSDAGYFYKPRDEMPEQFRKYYSNDGVQAWLVGIPLIAAATYWRKKTEDSKNTVNNWDSITPENISLVHPKKALLCPLITDYMALAPLKDIYKYAYEDYKNTAGYMNWALGWRRVYYYLGGTEDLS